jgi:hypothetical protein
VSGVWSILSASVSLLLTLASPVAVAACCLTDHQVYYFSKFSVKVANKQYATVRNDYELHFDNRCVACKISVVCVCVCVRVRLYVHACVQASRTAAITSCTLTAGAWVKYPINMQ